MKQQAFRLKIGTLGLHEYTKSETKNIWHTILCLGAGLSFGWSPSEYWYLGTTGEWSRALVCFFDLPLTVWFFSITPMERARGGGVSTYQVYFLTPSSAKVMSNWRSVIFDENRWFFEWFSWISSNSKSSKSLISASQIIENQWKKQRLRPRITPRPLRLSKQTWYLELLAYYACFSCVD